MSKLSWTKKIPFELSYAQTYKLWAWIENASPRPFTSTCETLNTRREGGSRPIRGDKENESEIHGKAYAKTKREKREEKDEIYNRKRSTFTLPPTLKQKHPDQGEKGERERKKFVQ
ncbi:hypothetical protein K435DRAFT_805397 [Dendrothele bispora CBS 962.96]|uniref:Uncharacterized protein n=1 Tax=Dendrothele bispora (strain CBS 962.96) TaxID=1314807 RepID=A0A4S8LB52_DENBC|nr:hypothetical protein K435DRAFT_805397 [Dendrothele bispora CBS 962.96]